MLRLSSKGGNGSITPALVCFYVFYLEKKIVDLKTEFLRIFFWRFIEVKWTIVSQQV
jgi:hypothetical protein